MADHYRLAHGLARRGYRVTMIRAAGVWIIRATKKEA